MLNKCDHCPLKDKQCACPGQRNRQICSRSDVTSPDYRERMREQLLTEVCGEHASTAPSSPPSPPPSSPPPSSEQTALQEKIALIAGCDYRTDTLDECSCTGRRHCGLGKGSFANEPWAVSYADCLRCVSGSLKTGFENGT